MKTLLSQELSEIVSDPAMGNKIIEYFNNLDKKKLLADKEIIIKLDSKTDLFLESAAL